ncbi:MAG: PilZ domain-containing protein [Spirochaetales bacterium]|nr:PilZ domain-containing protein [Spirochaetales bacterium]
MINNRQKEREICYAKIILTNTNLIGWVRDISEIGCRTDFPVPTKPEQDKVYPFHIIAEESAGGVEVLGTCQVRWQKEGAVFNSAGFEVISFHNEKDREAYKTLFAYYQPVPEEEEEDTDR